MEFSDCRLYRAIAEEKATHVAAKILELTTAGRDVNIKDEKTGETFMHIVAKYSHKFTDPRSVPAVYQLCKVGIDLNAVDNEYGDTALHRLVRTEGTYRIVVALLRCGADPTIKDKESLTPEEVLRERRLPGWEEILHWFQKFKPGLQHAVMASLPDVANITHLLKNWSRVKVSIKGQSQSLVCLAEERKVDVGVIRLLRYYEDQNEMVIAALAGDAKMLRKLLKQGTLDVNARDESYQYYFKRYPCVPRPLLVTVWEQDNIELLKTLLEYKPELTHPFKYHYKLGDSKPLFFYLAGSQLQPKKEPLSIEIFKMGNLQYRNIKGRTILFEAVSQYCSLNLFRELLRLGADLSLRDGAGETVRDYAKRRGRDVYVDCIDKRVNEVVGKNDTETVMGWLLNDYNHILDVVKADAWLQHRVYEDVKLIEIRKLLQASTTMQAKIKRSLKYADDGNLPMIGRIVESSNVWRGRNKCGQTLLHRALLAKSSQVPVELALQYPDLLHIPDNLMRTPLHYACLLFNDPEFQQTIENLGADPKAKDVWDRIPHMYKKTTATTYDYLRLLDEVNLFQDRVHLIEIDFEEKLYQAIDEGKLDAVRHLVEDNGVGNQLSRYSRVLFYCVDSDRSDIAKYLIKAGCDPEIWKEYKDSEDGSHKNGSLMSLRDRAEQKGQYYLATQINECLATKTRSAPGYEIQGKQKDNLSAFEEVSLYGLTVS